MPQPVITIGIAILSIFSILFLGLFVASGGASGNTHDDVMIEIDASAAEIMEWLTEPDKLELWIEGLDEVRVESFAQFGAGTEYYYASEIYGDTELIVEAWDPDRLLRLSYDAGVASGIATMELTEQGNTTTLRYLSDTKFEPFLIRLMLPLFIGSARDQLMEDLNTLKQLVESTPQD